MAASAMPVPSASNRRAALSRSAICVLVERIIWHGDITVCVANQLRSSHESQQLSAQIGSYLLRSGSHHRTLRSATYATCSASIFDNADLEPFCNEAQDALVRDTVLEETDNP